MSAAQRLLGLIHRAERLIALLAFAVMALVIIADVLSREVTGSGIAGAPRIAVFAMIITALISFGLASTANRHLRPRFADRLVPRRWDPMMRRLQEAVTAVFCLAFAVVAVEVVAETRALGETSRMLRIPIWPMQAVFPLAFGIAAVRHGLYAAYPALRPPPPSVAAVRTEQDGPR